MPPTVNAPHTQERDKRVRTGERKSDLVCRVKYSNSLPDIPFDPKFINYPFHTNRYVQYKPTSLEKNYKYEILTEHDLGVNIDLIDPSAYAQPLPHQSPAPNNLHPDDEKLMEDDTHTPQAAKKSRHSHVNVSWLRRTEYISNELTRYQPQNNDRIEATVGYGGRRKAKMEEPAYTDRDSQLEAIERTFEEAKEPLMEHYSKPGVTAIEELPIFPDFDLWKYPCAQVIFDSDPAPVGRPVPAAIDEMSQAMIRGVMDESGEQFVAYFLPTEETLKKRKRDAEEEVDYMDDDVYDYLMAREYNWNVKNKASKGYEENYFFVVRNDAVYYNELETRVRLSKRRQKQSLATRSKSRLVVTHRPLTSTEHRTHRHRDGMLQPHGEEEEEEEEEDDQEEEEKLMDMQNGDGTPVNSDDEGRRRSKSGSRSRSASRSRSGSRSRSKSGSRSRSRSKSRNQSRSRSKSGSRSRSRSKSGSRSRSHSKSGSRSRSHSNSGSRSRSRSKSGSRSRSRSKSGSRSRSHSKSGSRSRSRSKSGSRSRSRSKSGSRSRSRSKLGSRSRSRSKSGNRSRSRSKSRSRSRSRSKVGSRSRSRSGSRSPSRSRSRSKSRSGSRSPVGSHRSRSGSRSPSGSPGGSHKSGSGSPRSRSGSPAGSQKSGGSSSPGSPASNHSNSD